MVSTIKYIVFKGKNPQNQTKTKTNQTTPKYLHKSACLRGEEKHVGVCFHRKISLCSENESNMQGL